MDLFCSPCFVATLCELPTGKLLCQLGFLKSFVEFLSFFASFGVSQGAEDAGINAGMFWS